jgi:beta-galactosidase GanA
VRGDDHDAHFHNVRSLARVAIVAATHSNRFYKAPGTTDPLDSVQGLYAALIEARIPFDLVLESDLGPERLKQYDAVLLPNVALLSDTQAAQLSAYAAAGGSLLTSFETGLYDAAGKPRDDFALAGLFRMNKSGDRADSHKALPGPGEATYPMASTHLQRLEKPHPITAGFRNTTRILGSNWSIPVRSDGESVLTLIDPYPTYPTEQTYSRAPHTTKPALIVRENGRSRLAHFTGDVEGTYWRSNANDLADLIVATVRWLVRDDPGLEIAGIGLVEVFPWRWR